MPVWSIVYREDLSELDIAKAQTNYNYTISWGEYDDTWVPLTDLIKPPAIVEVKDGKLNITLGSPRYFFNYDDSLNVTDYDARISRIDYFGTADDKYWLLILESDKKVDADGFSLFAVRLLYTDRDVTVKGQTETKTDTSTDIFTFNMSLQKGWNYEIVTLKYYGTDAEFKYTASKTLPSDLKWVVYRMSND